MTETLLEPAPVIESDDFLNSLKEETQLDGTPPAPPPLPKEPKPATASAAQDDDEMELLEDPELLAELGIEAFDIVINIALNFIAEENNNPAFDVPESKKNKVKKPLAIILKRQGISVNPWLMFSITLVIVYAPYIYKAISIKREKDKKKKALKATSAKTLAPQPGTPPSAPAAVTVTEEINLSAEELNIEVPRNPGRPRGSKDSYKRSTKTRRSR